DHLAAVFAERQVLEHAVALGRRKYLLGKGRQHIRIRMRSLGPGSLRQSGPQAVNHDFWYFGHVSVSRFRQSVLPSPASCAGTFPSGNVLAPESCVKRERKFNCRSRTSVSSASVAWAWLIPCIR